MELAGEFVYLNKMEISSCVVYHNRIVWNTLFQIARLFDLSKSVEILENRDKC